MAGDWIKMRADLQTHPKVFRISSAMNADKLKTVGALHAVWCLFDVHSIDGELEGYTFGIIDNQIGWEGFGKAMSDVDWVVQNDRGLVLPEFDTHNGQPAKRRAQEADRKRKDRESGKASASGADKKRTRGEESREDNKHSPAKAGQCPVQQVIDLYNKTANNLPQCRVASDAMKKNISNRWKQSVDFQTLDFWKELFGYCENHEFLSGRGDSRNGQKPFRVSLDWIVNATNFAKIVNLNYDRA